MFKILPQILCPITKSHTSRNIRQLERISGRLQCFSKQPTSLTAQLRAKIKVTGPITVADYMKEVLINPSSGYYAHQQSIGAQGDFITSPELTQLFGEMIAVWILNEWHKIGSPKPMNLVELGPGKGTLMEDILRVFKHLNQINGVDVHLVELSPKLQDEQARRLCSELTVSKGGEQLHFAWGTSHFDCPIYWHHALSEVPRDVFTCVIAHEFFDALPVHKLQHLNQINGVDVHFVELSPKLQDEQARRMCSELTVSKGGEQLHFAWDTSHFDCPIYWHHAPNLHKTPDGWREILIDFDSANEESNKFRYIISRSATPASQVFSAKYVDDSREHVEVCLEGGAMMQDLAKRFEEDGGFLLMADYGHDGTGKDTFRGFKNHQLHDPLVDPGSADLTADVDFKFLKESTSNNALTFGPVSQKDFLTRLGIEYRLEVLMQNPKLSKEEKEKLKASVYKLIHPSQMGERFKFFAVFPKVLQQHLNRFPVSGFENLKQ